MALLRRQHGRITWAQLTALGLSGGTVTKWTASGRLTRTLPSVYAVGPAIPTHEARLWEAILYAGPGAMLSHRSAAHHRELIDHAPQAVEVSTPLRKRSIPGVVRVRAQRVVARTIARDIPATTIAQTILDLAAVEPALLPRALAVLDYRGRLDRLALEATCGSGRLGSTALRAALDTHQPLLARTNGELEERFLRFCERSGLPLPRLNVRIHGFIVDAYWPDHDLVVELDGHANHSSPAQRHRDRKRELVLRSHGIRLARYDWGLLKREPDAMRADLRGQLGITDQPARSLP